jgi:predicted type IV restriction endonuclease
MPAPQKIIDLIERFTENRHAYMSTGYNETQVRRELIDPLFKALGWDIDNEAGYAEGYKDVVHEDAIKVGGATRAPDYAFRCPHSPFFLHRMQSSLKRNFCKSFPTPYGLWYNRCSY